MRTAVISTSCACLLLLLPASVIPAFNFQPVKDEVIGTPNVRSRFPSNERVTYLDGVNSTDSYRFVTPEATALRAMARTYTWGMGSNRFQCVDLRTSDIVWKWYLDSPVVQVLQTNGMAFALTFRSLYAIDLASGKPRWQIDAKSGQIADAITVTRSERPVKISNGEERDYFQSLGITALSYLAYNESADEIVLSLQDNSLMAIREDGRILARQTPVNQADDPSTINIIKGLYSSENAVYVFYGDRLLQRLENNLKVSNQIYFPESSIKGLGEFPDKALIVGGRKDLVYSWDLTTSKMRAATGKLSAVSAATKTRDGNLLVSTIKGLVDIDPETLEAKWTFQGKKMTAWFAVVPITFHEYSWQVWSFAENGRHRKVLISGNQLIVVDARTGAEQSRTSLPVSLGESRVMKFMWNLIGTFSVPPYVDTTRRHMYLPISEIGGKVTQALDGFEVQDHVVEISW